jgi:hypothetical protein
LARERMSNWEKLLSLLRPRSGIARWALLLLSALAVFLLAASTVTVLADSRHRGEMFPNTTVLGVDVTGMSREEAVERVREEVVAPLMTPLTLSFRGRKWVIDPQELNLHVDVEALVDLAYRAGWERSVFERALRRAFNRPLDINIGLEYSMDRDLLTRKLNAVAAEIYCEVRNASPCGWWRKPCFPARGWWSRWW